MDVLVSALHRYPVKGMRGQPVPFVDVERCGFTGDRRWMVVDPGGRFLTQRQQPALARISVTSTPDGMILQAEDAAALFVPQPADDAETTPVTVWRSTVPAVRAGTAAADWLQAALGIPCQLVYLADADARAVNPDYAQPGDRVSFADGYPVLLTSDASLDDLNRRLARPVPMQRFRPNLVVGGAGAWAEDRWRRVRVGPVVFRLPKPCSRCLVPSVDQQTGERPDPHEPLHTLGTFRRGSGGVMFGQNMIPETLGRIAVGDRVEILESGDTNVQPVAAPAAG